MVLLTEWEQEGRAEATRSLVLRLVARKFGPLRVPLTERLIALSPEQLETLGEALLDFTSPDELMAWLDQTTAS